MTFSWHRGQSGPQGIPGTGVSEAELIAAINADNVLDGSEYETQTDATSTQIDSLTLSNLDAASRVDSATSSARSRIAWEDAAEVTELWDALTAWQAADVQIIDGSVYRVTTLVGSYPTAVRAIAIGTVNKARLRGSFVVPVAGAGAGICFAGFWTGATDAPITAAPNAAYGVGVKENGRPYRWFAGAQLELSASPLAAGTYYWSATADTTWITVTLSNATETAVYSDRVGRPGSGITGVMLYNSDTRHSAGVGIGPVGARADTVTAKVRTGIEGLAPSGEWTQLAGAQNIRISLPTNYDSRKPTPLVLYSHANNGTEMDPLLLPPDGPYELTATLVANGYAVASSTQHGNNWGSQVAVDDLYALYKYFRDRYSLGPVVILAQSMGGAAALTAIRQRRIPGIRGFCGIFPVCNLASMYAAGNYATAIRTAHSIAGDGSDYAAKTAGLDPALGNGPDFRGIPMRFYHSSGDTLVNKADNSDVIAALVAPYAPEATVVVTTGDHGDTINFQGTDVLAFFNRCIAAS